MFTRLALIITLAASEPAAEWFVAPDGNDRAPGTRVQPFASVGRAQSAATAGDTVFLRGGTYRMEESMIARRDRLWAYVILLDKSGSPGKPIRYRAAEGEKPSFDFSRVKPAGMRVHAFQVSSSHVHLEGIAVTGVQVTATGHTQSVCFSTAPRKQDGGLPEIPLMHPAPAGKIVDRGVSLDLPFTGRAPDPGAYEAPPAAAAP